MNITTLLSKYAATSLLHPTGGTEYPTPAEIPKALGMAIRSGAYGAQHGLLILRRLPYWVHRAIHCTATGEIPTDADLELSEEVYRRDDNEDGEYGPEPWTVDDYLVAAREDWSGDARFDADDEFGNGGISYSAVCRWYRNPYLPIPAYRSYRTHEYSKDDDAVNRVMNRHTARCIIQQVENQLGISSVQLGQDYEDGKISGDQWLETAKKNYWLIQGVWNDEYGFLEFSMHWTVQELLHEQREALEQCKQGEPVC